MFNHQADYELEKTKKKFREYYNNELKHKYEELEPIRWMYLTWLVIFGCFFLFVDWAWVYGFLHDNNLEEISLKDFTVKIFLGVLAFLLNMTYCAFALPIAYYKRKTKLVTMDKVLGFFREFKYSTDDIVFSESYIAGSALFGRSNKQQADDAFGGQYHNVNIKISEQKIVYGYDHDSSDRSFRGVLIALQLNKKYVGKTIALGKNIFTRFFKKKPSGRLKQYLLSIKKAMERFKKKVDQSDLYTVLFLSILAFFICAFSILISVFGSPEKVINFIICLLFVPVLFLCLYEFKVNRALDARLTQIVNLEDVIFSKKWNIYAGDQVEARYVLTPALMERMLAVKKLFHGNRIDFSFWGKNLLIAVHTRKDMFETTSLFKSALDYKKVEEVICQMYSVFSVIDALKLQN